MYKSVKGGEEKGPETSFLRKASIMDE